jgi:hypothetical protein
VELISRDRGTTKALGANRGAPQALQIADRWHLLRNLGEALEKVLAKHHADLKRAFTPPEEEYQLTAALDQQALARLKALSQAEQLRQARREQHEAVFRRVQELSAQGQSYILLPPGSSAIRPQCRLLSPTLGVKAKWKGKSIVSSCSSANRMGVLDLSCYAIGSLPDLSELCTEDEQEPKSFPAF